MRPFVTLAGLALIAVVLAYARLAKRVETLEAELASNTKPLSPAAAAPPPITPRADLTELEKTTVDLFAQRSKAVVHITTVKLETDIFRLNALAVPQGMGSGFVWDTDGHVITNYHVIREANGARVTLADQSVWEADLVGKSPRNDIAVLRIRAPKEVLMPIAIGTSQDLAVGQQVYAIGSPFGLDATLSTGIISGLGREIEGLTGLPIHGAIQTDAAINPGNSGGPLLDSGGRLIGMNTSILSPSGGSAGVGFAVPIQIITRAVPELIKYGREVRPTIGAQYAADAITRRFGLRGALILETAKDSPAEKAGLRPTRQERATGRIVLGDCIIGIDGKPIETDTDLFLALEQYKAGDKIKLSVYRDGDAVDVEVELASNVGV
ncbi:MAG TPA: trypsin-like peptidase domain-containing protein [Polyangiales bacterium]|nr:trypsin-like peptidase domain-containing protein [Polyangiales bacterium]